MLREAGIYPCRQILQRAYLPHYPWLRENVVVLDAIEEFGEAPERIGFYGIEDGLGKLPGVHAACDVIVTDIRAEEDLPEGSDKVVDALDVARGGVPDGPDVEDTLERALGGLIAIELKMGGCTGDIDRYLVPERFV